MHQKCNLVLQRLMPLQSALPAVAPPSLGSLDAVAIALAAPPPPLPGLGKLNEDSREGAEAAVTLLTARLENETRARAAAEAKSAQTEQRRVGLDEAWQAKYEAREAAPCTGGN